MADQQTNQVLCFVLESLRDLHLYSKRQHQWITAITYAIEKDAALESRLKDHPWFDLGPAPSLRNIDAMTQNIDALIQQLRADSTAG